MCAFDPNHLAKNTGDNMRQKVVNGTFCLDYIEEYCDRTGTLLPIAAAKEAANLMVRYLTKGEALEFIPKAAVEDAAMMAVLDARLLLGLTA